MCHGERDTDRRRGREISGRIRSKAGRGTCDSKDRGGNRYAIFFGRAPWFRGCWETGKVRSCFENLLGKLEYGLICLPTATAARLPLSKAVTFQLLQLLWSCSVDVLLDQCQSTNPTPDSPPPPSSSSGVAVITHFFFMCSRWICARQECHEYTCFNKAADKSLQSHREDVLYNHPECPNERVVSFPFMGRDELKFKNEVLTPTIDLFTLLSLVVGACLHACFLQLSNSPFHTQSHTFVRCRSAHQE